MAHQFYFNPYILDNLPSPDSGFDVVQDISEPRLRMYITSRGVKTFFVRKRVGGRDRRIIIGNYPDMDIEDARSAVADVLSRAMEKPKARRRKISFAKLTELYLTNRVRRSEDGMTKLRRGIARHLAPLAEKNVTDITAADIGAVIDAISGAAVARRMQELIQSIFKYGMECGYVATNPMRGIKKVELRRRPRTLTRGGVRNLISAIDEHAPSVVLRAAFLMLIYGFAPKSRVFTMQWSDLDFNQYMWGTRPLSDAAVVLLQDLPQDGNWVFSVRGRMCLADPRTAWRRVVSAAGMPNLTMDDVHKFMMRNLIWASSAEDLRTNMNALIEEIME